MSTRTMPTDIARRQSSWRPLELVIQEFAYPAQRQQSADSNRRDERAPTGREAPSQTRRHLRDSEVECGLKPAEDFLRVRREHHQRQERDNPKVLEHELRAPSQMKRD